MEKAVKVDRVSYWYPSSSEPALKELSVEVEKGEFVLVVGSSGAGKSTFCRLLNGLVPGYSGGIIEGSVFVNGRNTKDFKTEELATDVGMMFQDPENQTIMSVAENEVAFALENKCLKPEAIRERISEVSEKLGIKHLLARNTAELSGGERQKIVLASVLALKPEVLVLDEPTSQLDPAARRDFVAAVADLNKKHGLTVVLVEHNISEVIEYADWVFDIDSQKRINPKDIKCANPYSGIKFKKTKSIQPVVDVRALEKSYGGTKALSGVDLSIMRGEFVALTGPNGCGKTTLVKHLNGLLKPDSGSVEVFGMDVSKTPREALTRRVAYLPQNPSDCFFADTVEEELRMTLKNFGVEREPHLILSEFSLSEHSGKYPRDISVGQRQRLALACVTCHSPELIILDEPTRGIDEASRIALTHLIWRLHERGSTIVLITQDLDLAMTANRRIWMDGGRVLG